MFNKNNNSSDKTVKAESKENDVTAPAKTAPAEQAQQPHVETAKEEKEEATKS